MCYAKSPVSFFNFTAKFKLQKHIFKLISMWSSKYEQAPSTPVGRSSMRRRNSQATAIHGPGKTLGGFLVFLFLQPCLIWKGFMFVN